MGLTRTGREDVRRLASAALALALVLLIHAPPGATAQSSGCIYSYAGWPCIDASIQGVSGLPSCANVIQVSLYIGNPFNSSSLTVGVGLILEAVSSYDASGSGFVLGYNNTLVNPSFSLAPGEAVTKSVDLSLYDYAHVFSYLPAPSPAIIAFVVANGTTGDGPYLTTLEVTQDFAYQCSAPTSPSFAPSFADDGSVVGFPGDTLFVIGNGWTPSTDVSLDFGGSAPSVVVTADSSGSFSTQVVISASAAGDYTIQATQGSLSQTASINILSPSGNLDEVLEPM